MLGEISELGVKPGPECGMTPRIFEFLIARIRAVIFLPLLIDNTRLVADDIVMCLILLWITNLLCVNPEIAGRREQEG